MKKQSEKKRIKWEDRAPTLSLRGKNFLPELKDLHVDDVVELVITAKMTRKEEGGYEYEPLCCDDDCDCGDDHEENRKKMSADFKIQSIKSNGQVVKNMSPEAKIAAKFNKNRKSGMSASQAMNRARS